MSTNEELAKWIIDHLRYPMGICECHDCKMARQVISSLSDIDRLTKERDEARALLAKTHEWLDRYRGIQPCVMRDKIGIFIKAYAKGEE